MQVEKNSKMLKANRNSLLLFLIIIFAVFYRVILALHTGFPPGADIGLHQSLIHSITQEGNTNFLYNYYHMGGGNSNTFPGYHIFVSFISFFTGLPDYLSQTFLIILFSSLLVLTAFLITRKLLNETVALIVAFLVAVSYYDIFIILWSGYPNIVTLMLIPLTFYVLLEKNRFPRLPRITVVSLLSATIFLTHSLSAFIFIAIILTSVFITLCFPRQAGIARKDALEWLFPLFVGGLVVAPFLIQAAPFYLNFNSSVYTGGLPDIQKVLLPMRLIPVEFILPFFVCSFLYFLFVKYMQTKLIPFSKILLVLWIIIPTVLTQSYFFGFYMDYERFLYFANLPLIILIGTGIFVCARLIGKNTDWFLSTAGKLLQKRFCKNKILRRVNSYPSNLMVVLFACILILVTFFELPHFSMTPSEGFRLQQQLQVADNQCYEAIQWIKNYTPTNSVFVADALYGWWLGGFAQRPTISAIQPVFITNSREFEPALLATRLLDTDYLIDNGLIQIREYGGYTDTHNPEFLVKLNNSYYPLPFLNFNNNQTTITFMENNDVKTVKISELSVIEMNIEKTATSATICIKLENEFFNLTQNTTVYQGVRFVNITKTLSSNNPTISFISMNYTVQTRNNVVTTNGSSIMLIDPIMNVAGQLIFNETHPSFIQGSKDPLEIVFNLNSQSKTNIDFYVTVFEYSNLDLTSTTQAGLYELFMNNTKSHSDKVTEFPLDIFDYRQAIINLNASYIAIRDHSQIERFVKDPLFNLVFINEKIAIFQI